MMKTASRQPTTRTAEKPGHIPTAAAAGIPTGRGSAIRLCRIAAGFAACLRLLGKPRAEGGGLTLEIERERKMRYKEGEEITSKEDYLKCYSEDAKRNNPKISNKQKLALKVALNIRKFETNLHWKRSIYFWGFLSVAFAAYFSVLNTNETIKFPIQKEYILLVISIFGVFLAFCWFCINKASAYWIRNWERQVELLEDEIMGPLYKRNVSNTGNQCYVTRPSKYSTSKINQLVSAAIIVLWLFLLIITGYQILQKINISFENIIVFIMILVFIILFFILFRRCHHERDKSKKTWIIEEREIVGR
jgi:hypothetical protein